MAREDLTSARVGRNDEFYTQLPDIEKELMYYKQHFQDKVVLCNCDDPYESNFFKYFALNFNALGLKKLMATCYNGSPVSGNELLLDFGDTIDDPKKIAYKVEITEECLGHTPNEFLTDIKPTLYKPGQKQIECKVCEEVLEVFEMTGFADILTIE